jgi:hypothetical protein
MLEEILLGVFGWAAFAVALGTYGAIFRLVVERFFFPEIAGDFWEKLKWSCFAAAVGAIVYTGMIILFFARRPEMASIPLVIISIFLLHSIVMMKDIYSDKKEYGDLIRFSESQKRARQITKDRNSLFDMINDK